MDWRETGVQPGSPRAAIDPTSRVRLRHGLPQTLAFAVVLFAALAAAAAAQVPSVNSITSNPTLPQLGGTTITWTANTSGGIAPLQFKWWRLNVNTNTWYLGHDWATGNTYTWVTTQADAGTWSIQVWVRNAGSTATYDTYGSTGNFIITSTTPFITGFSASVSFPRNYGTSITWTPTILGGITPLQYKYLLYSQLTAQWTIVQNWSTTRTFTWTPTVNDVGRYSLQVWVRNNGSTTQYDAYAEYANFDITAPPPVITAVATQTIFPTPAGRAITWTVSTTGGLAPLQYRFLRYNVAAGTFTTLQDYSTSNTASWLPGAGDPGQYSLQVWVRNKNSSLTYDAYTNTPVFTINPPDPLSVTSLTAAPGLPRPVGSILLFKATVTGGVAPIQYKFLRYSYASSQWIVMQDYAPNDTLVWTPTPSDASDHSIQVWVRSAGSTAPYDAYGDYSRFSIMPPTSDIVRFLEQTTFGPTDALIQEVYNAGYRQWLNMQFAMPPSGYPAFAPVPDDPDAACGTTCQRDNYTMYPLQRRFFQNALYGNDQLRQRVAWALHQLVVTSGLDLPLPSWYQPYLQSIYLNAFGNYRQLLYDVTLNAAMGVYLDMATSTKFQPNENYAREILQLFSTGTDLLNPDGTPQTLANGDIIPVYDQFAVTQFAKIFTGWRLAADLGPNITNYRDAMVPVNANHDLSQKTLLRGTVTAAGQTPLADLNSAIDNIFNHPNVGPYIAKHLIRKLVTSNPSPAYVQRVAGWFNNNGSGVRGDMQTVVLAVILDPEARQATQTANEGHLKEPALFITNLLRAFNPLSADGLSLSDGYLAPQAANLGEDVLRPPTVFSYYPADYLTPGSSTVLGPEFGVFSSTTALRRANFVNTMVFSKINPSTDGPQGTSIDLTPLLSVASNTDALLKELDRLLLHDTMSPTMKRVIGNAVNVVSTSNPLLRVQTALYLVASSSQYQVQR